jgi:hypothetical protein
MKVIHLDKLIQIALSASFFSCHISEKVLAYEPHDSILHQIRIARSVSGRFWSGDPRNVAAAYCRKQSGVLKDWDGFNFRCGSQLRYGLGNALDTYSNISDACMTLFYIGRRLNARNGKAAIIIASDGWENGACTGTVEVN